MALARFKDLCVDATDDDWIEAFWAGALGLEIIRRSDGSSYLQEPGDGLTLWVNAVPEPRAVKNRVHLDVHCTQVDELLQLGATVRREPTDQEPWWSLSDPEGGELCAFVRDQLPSHRLYEMVVDSADPRAQAAWWQGVLGGDIEASEDDFTETGAAAIERVPGLPAEYIVFQQVPEPKTAKNRLHWDVTAEDVAELVRRGARVLRQPTDDEAWHVLADPEGNEFCVFAS